MLVSPHLNILKAAGWSSETVLTKRMLFLMYLLIDHTQDWTKCSQLMLVSPHLNILKAAG